MEKRGNSRADWSNYWQGRAAGKSGEVFAGVGVERSDELARFWRLALGPAAAQPGPVVDVASGAGSVLKHLPPRGGDAPVGERFPVAVDISGHAIAAAIEAVPGLAGLVGSADRLPLADGVAGHVVSQFGFEYADRAGTPREMARILSPGGRFTAIVHMVGGGIAAECAGHVARLDTIEGSGFIPASKALFAAVFAFEAAPSAAGKSVVEAAFKALGEAQARLQPAVAAGGFAAHLQTGAHQLYERRRGYVQSDITGWFDGMEAEIAAYRGRMEGMLAAAMAEADCRAVLSAIDPSGAGKCTPFDLGGKPAAWALEAVKPG